MNRQAALLIASKPELWDRYSSWLAILHPKYCEEVQAMAKATGKKLEINWQPFLAALREDKSGELRKLLLQALSVDDMIRIIGRERFVERLGKAERQALKRLLK